LNWSGVGAIVLSAGVLAETLRAGVASLSGLSLETFSSVVVAKQYRIGGESSHQVRMIPI
jgi:hypothetical protein